MKQMHLPLVKSQKKNMKTTQVQKVWVTTEKSYEPNCWPILFLSNVRLPLFYRWGNGALKHLTKPHRWASASTLSRTAHAGCFFTLPTSGWLWAVWATPCKSSAARGGVTRRPVDKFSWQSCLQEILQLNHRPITRISKQALGLSTCWRWEVSAPNTFHFIRHFMF